MKTPFISHKICLVVACPFKYLFQFGVHIYVTLPVTPRDVETVLSMYHRSMVEPTVIAWKSKWSFKLESHQAQALPKGYDCM